MLRTTLFIATIMIQYPSSRRLGRACHLQRPFFRVLVPLLPFLALPSLVILLWEGEVVIFP